MAQVKWTVGYVHMYELEHGQWKQEEFKTQEEADQRRLHLVLEGYVVYQTVSSTKRKWYEVDYGEVYWTSITILGVTFGLLMLYYLYLVVSK